MVGETTIVRAVYNRAPIWLQNRIVTEFGRIKDRQRYGRGGDKWLAFYRQASGWSAGRLRAYQDEQLRRTIVNAYQYVPFYRERFDRHGVGPADIRTVADLGKLPVLERETVRDHSLSLISKRYHRRRLMHCPTSGSTGMPVDLYFSRESLQKNFAYRWANARPGVVRKDRSAWFSGLELIPPKQSGPPYWRMNRCGNQRLYSVFHMSDETLPHYLDDLERFRPTWIYGYPSALYILSEYMNRVGYTYPYPVRTIVTSSEECLPIFRNAVEKAFGTRVRDEYGQGEMTGLAFECECGKLHECMDYAIMEFHPTGNRAEGLDVHELICTSIINDCWPLIRYRVGDLALLDPESKCPVGRPGRVIDRIYGRTAHVLVTKDGARISNISVIAKKCRHLKGIQAVQDRAGEVVLRVVPLPTYVKERDEPFMIDQFRRKFGGRSRMEIHVEYADDLQRTSAGKVLMIVSRLPREQVDRADEVV